MGGVETDRRHHVVDRRPLVPSSIVACGASHNKVRYTNRDFTETPSPRSNIGSCPCIVVAAFAFALDGAPITPYRSLISSKIMRAPTATALLLVLTSSSAYGFAPSATLRAPVSGVAIGRLGSVLVDPPAKHTPPPPPQESPLNTTCILE